MAVDLFTVLASDVAVKPGDVVLLCNFRIHWKLLKSFIQSKSSNALELSPQVETEIN
jgi:hypothetical protein